MATKKRMIFTLLYDSGYFCQSRNFHCQKVGDFEWLFNNYNFSRIAEYLDELIVINVNPTKDNNKEFLKTVERIVENVFIPVAIGGGIISLDSAISYLNSGADKIILNSTIRVDPETVDTIVNNLGSQSVVASIDYRTRDNKSWVYDWKTKKNNENEELLSYLEKCHDFEFGEILLNSVDKDGTGFGLDIDVIEEVSLLCKLPLIVMGGAGKFDHFPPAYEIPAVDAVATANLLNFIGDSLPATRRKLIEYGIELARFS